MLTADAVMLEAGGVETRAQYVATHLPADIEFEKAVTTRRTPGEVVIAAGTRKNNYARSKTRLDI